MGGSCCRTTRRCGSPSPFRAPSGARRVVTPAGVSVGSAACRGGSVRWHCSVPAGTLRERAPEGVLSGEWVLRRVRGRVRGRVLPLPAALESTTDRPASPREQPDPACGPRPAVGFRVSARSSIVHVPLVRPGPSVPWLLGARVPFGYDILGPIEPVGPEFLRISSIGRVRGPARVPAGTRHPLIDSFPPRPPTVDAGHPPHRATDRDPTTVPRS